MIRLHNSTDLRRTGAVARAYGLRNVSMAGLDAKRHAPLYASAKPSTEGLSLRLTDEAAAQLTEDGDRMLVTVRFSVVLVTEDEKEVLGVSGAFELYYGRHAKGAEVSEEDLQAFGAINGVYNAWPYIRETVASTFVRLGYPPFTMESLVISARPDEVQATAEPSSGSSQAVSNSE